VKRVEIDAPHVVAVRRATAGHPLLAAAWRDDNARLVPLPTTAARPAQQREATAAIPAPP
jgi:hypothetical protein